MSGDRINGNWTAMAEFASQLDEATNVARQAILRVHARLDSMPGEGSWDDRNHTECNERMGELRGRVDSALDEMLILVSEISGLSHRYRDALG